MFKNREFKIEVVGPQIEDRYNDNVDVDVTFASGDRYVVTFMTLENIATIFRNHQITGESAGGLYQYLPNTIVVKKLDLDDFRKVVEDLIENDEFADIFDGPYRD